MRFHKNRHLRIYICLIVALAACKYQIANATCTNRQPIYRLTANGVSSYLFPSIHAINVKYADCPFPQKFDKITSSVNSIVIERYKVDGALGSNGLQVLLEAMYPDIAADTGEKIFAAGDSPSRVREIMSSAIQRVLETRGSSLSEITQTEISRWVEARFSKVNKSELMSRKKRFLAMSQEALLFELLGYPPDGVSKEENAVIPGHEILLQEIAKSKKIHMEALEKPSDIFQRIREAFPTKKLMEDAILTVIKSNGVGVADEENNAMSALIEGNTEPLTKLTNPSTASNFEKYIYIPMDRTRENYWVDKVKYMMTTKACPCLFALGAAHVVPTTFRDALKTAGVRVEVLSEIPVR